MSFNQGFGSAQAFNSGQWPLPQNQQHQQQLGMQGPPPQFMQPWQNPLQNQQTFPTSSFGWHASPQHIQYQHTQDKHHARQSSTGDIMAQNQELQKKQQYEEQKRKLKEMSKRGPKSKQEDGKNMLDALISKADLGLSSNSSLGGMKKPSNNRQTNVFTGHSRQETNTQHLAVEGFSHPQNFLQTSNQSATHFPQQADVAVVEHNMQNFQQNLQQWQIQPHLQQQPQQQLLNFGAKAGINQNMSPQYEDDFGDFQGGSTDGVYEQTSGSLNSSTSSLSSLKSSFNSGFQHIIASNPEANSSGPVLQGMYSNTSPRLLAGAEMSSISSLVHPLKAVSGSQHADEPGGVTQKPLEGFGSNSKVPHFSYATSSGFQTSNADSRTFTSDSTHTSGSFAAFPGSSVPEIAGQLLDSYTTGFIHKEEKPMQGQMNMTENPLPDGDGTPEESHIYGCQLPAWLHDSSLLPSVYRKVLSKSLSLDGSVDTAKVTDILLSSNIAKDKLRDIWEMANKKTPGLLIEGELYLILGLVALSQAGWTKLSISKLSSCNTAPIPEFPEHILMELDSELHVNEWKRCLEGVKKVFESTTSTMKKHSLSLSNKKEIFESEEGKQYFNGLKEIFAVACRIRVSIENSAIAKSSDDLKSLLKTIERYWREICSFSSGLPEYALPDAATYPPIDSTDASSLCGICLVDLNDKPVEWSNWKMSTTSLAYGSKKYHSTCANFWCNKVNPVLPALSPLAAGLL